MRRVEIVVTDKVIGQKEVFKCDERTLCSRMKYFDDVIRRIDEKKNRDTCGDSLRSGSSSTETITIQANCDLDIFASLLKFAKTSKICLSVDSVVSFLLSSNFLGMDDLFAMSSKFLLQNLVEAILSTVNMASIPEALIERMLGIAACTELLSCKYFLTQLLELHDRNGLRCGNRQFLSMLLMQYVCSVIAKEAWWCQKCGVLVSSSHTISNATSSPGHSKKNSSACRHLPSKRPLGPDIEQMFLHAVAADGLHPAVGGQSSASLSSREKEKISWGVIGTLMKVTCNLCNCSLRATSIRGHKCSISPKHFSDPACVRVFTVLLPPLKQVESTEAVFSPLGEDGEGLKVQQPYLGWSSELADIVFQGGDMGSRKGSSSRKPAMGSQRNVRGETVVGTLDFDRFHLVERELCARMRDQMGFASSGV